MAKVCAGLFSGAADGTYREGRSNCNGKMVLAYNELKGRHIIKPHSEVREVLAKVADEGAAWDPGVFSILDAGDLLVPAENLGIAAHQGRDVLADPKPYRDRSISPQV